MSHQKKSPVPPQAMSLCHLGTATAVTRLSSSLASSPSTLITHMKYLGPGVLLSLLNQHPQHSAHACRFWLPSDRVCIPTDGTTALHHEAVAECRPAAQGTGSFPSRLWE